MNDHADLIFVGGRVHTVNTTNDIVPALAVGGGRILAAGGDAEIRSLAGPGPGSWSCGGARCYRASSMATAI
jgi:predicted amidohydrolase YtcJ